MNISSLEHLLLFVVACAAVRYVKPLYVLAAAALLIELDQARSFVIPWWAWFTSIHYAPDTWLDIVCDAAGIWAGWALFLKKRVERTTVWSWSEKVTFCNKKRRYCTLCTLYDLCQLKRKRVRRPL